MRNKPLWLKAAGINLFLDEAMFEYRVVDIFSIDGQCIVFTGKVEQGEVHVGDRLLLKSPQGVITVTVKSLEPSGFRRSGAMTGDNVAVVVDPFSLDIIADGFCRGNDSSFEVRSLTLHGHCARSE
jgi:translation elongation factor EF-Tu-like GTPase